MNTTVIELPHHAIDLLTEASDELEVVLDELDDAEAGTVDAVEIADVYFLLVRHYIDQILTQIEEVEDKVTRPDGP